MGLNVFAQFNNTVVYDTYSGLPNNTIHKIYQDHFGFIWFCTEKGLSRFDGYTFTNFNSSNSGLSNEFTMDIIEDANNNLWIGTNDGLFCMDYKTSQIKDYSSFLYPKGGKYINALCKLSENTIGLATHDGLYSFNNSTLKLTKIVFNTKQITAHTQSSCFYLDASNTLWIGYKECGLVKWDLLINTFSFISIANTKSTIKTITGNNAANLWIGTDNNGIIKLNINTGKQEHYTQQKNKLGSNSINRLVLTKNGKLFAATEGGGINVLNIDTTFFTCYTKNNSTISNDKVWDIFEDNQQNIWLGHYLGGITYLNIHAKILRFIDASVLPYDVVSFIKTDSKNNLWIANDEGGLIKLNAKKQLEKIYNHNLINLRSDEYDAVITSYRDSKDNIWIGKFRSGVCLYNSTTKQIQALNTFFSNAEILNHADIRGFTEDKAGNIWIATHGQGLFCLHKSNHKVLHFSSTQKEPFRIDSEWLWYVYTDCNNYIWIAGNNGLFRYNPLKQLIETIIFPNDTKFTRACKNVLSLKEDNNHILWIGTSGGLLFYKNNTLNIKNIDILNYPCSINSIEIDSRNNIWMGTNLGILNYNQTTNSAKLIDKKNEIINTEFSINAVTKDSKGYLYFGGNKGILWFHPDSLIQNTEVPKLYFTDLKLYYKSVHTNSTNSPLTQDIIHTNQIILDHSQRIFSIEFAALNYNQPEKNEYLYQLEGIDKEWIKCGNKRQASYMNLPAGTYTFKVRGSNNNGIWNTKGIALLIKIHPPWWNTWWFRLLLLLTISGSILIIFKRRVNNIIKQNKELEEKVEQRTKEISQQAEQLRNQNSLLIEQQEEIYYTSEEIKTQSEELLQTNSELKKANITRDRLFSIIAHDLRNHIHIIYNFTEKLGLKFKELPKDKIEQNIHAIEQETINTKNLLSNLLNWAQVQASDSSYKPEPFLINQYIQSIISQIYLHAQQKNITLNFSPDIDYTVYADKNMFEIIIRNFLSNAIKFTPANRTISLYTKQQDELIEIAVTDTGKGIDENILQELFQFNRQIQSQGTNGETGSGIGLSICNELATKMNGHIKATSKPGKGSTFSLYIEQARIPVIATEIKTISTNIIQIDSHEELQSFKDKIVLIVDDSEQLRQQLRIELEQHVKVIETSDGASCFEMAKKTLPDIIISDVMMPGMDGFELCRKLKTDIQTSHIPVILLTAKSTDTSRIVGLETGADDYILKPFNAELLIVRIKNIMQQRSQLKTHYIKQLINDQPIEETENPDSIFMKKAIAIIEENLEDSSFSVEEFAQKIGMSRTQLFRKFKAITGESPHELIDSIRLNRAKKLLEQNTLNISEIAYSVGYSNPQYFSKRFKAMFGVVPTEYKK